jgi:hypothetical protein
MREIRYVTRPAQVLVSDFAVAHLASRAINGFA